MRRLGAVTLCALAGMLASYLLRLGLAETLVMVAACGALPLINVILGWVLNPQPSFSDRKRFGELRKAAHDAVVATMEHDPKNKTFLQASDPTVLCELLAVMVITASVCGDRAAVNVLYPILEETRALHWTKVLRNRKKAMSLRQ